MADVNLTVKCDGMDEINSKAQQIVNKMKEARTLAGELASELDRLEVKVNDQPTDKIEGRQRNEGLQNLNRRVGRVNR